MTKLTIPLQKFKKTSDIREKRHRQMQGTIPIKLAISQQPKAVKS